jgi:hypothetical protein
MAGIARLAGRLKVLGPQDDYPMGTSAAYRLSQITPNGVQAVTPPANVANQIIADGGLVNRQNVMVVPLSPYEVPYQTEERLRRMMAEQGVPHASYQLQQVLPQSYGNSMTFEDLAMGINRNHMDGLAW